MNENIVKHIKEHLFSVAENTPKTKAVFYKTGKGDYAEHDSFIGVPVPDLRKVAKQHRELSLQYLQILLHSKTNEERLLALLILTDQYANNKNEIYQFYMANLSQVNNWNLVDASAHLIIGNHLLDRDKEILFRLARSSDLWERRIAIVATWHFIKNNQHETTLKVAEIFLGDDHDLIHKASGWMLREVGKKDIDILRNFLNRFVLKMPRTMLRYAIEKFQEAERKHYLQVPRGLF